MDNTSVAVLSQNGILHMQRQLIGKISRDFLAGLAGWIGRVNGYEWMLVGGREEEDWVI